MYHVNTFRMKNAELFKGIPSGKKQVTMLRRVKNLFLCLIFTNTKSSRVKFNLTGQYYRHVPNINVNTDCKRIKITTSQDVPPPYVRESSTFIFKVREFLPWEQQQVSSKRLHQTTKPQEISSQKTIILRFKTARDLNLTNYTVLYEYCKLCGLSCHDKWVPVTTAWRVLRLRMEERPPVWSAAANILTKQSRRADKGWSSSLGVGRGTNNSSV